MFVSFSPSCVVLFALLSSLFSFLGCFEEALLPGIVDKLD